jgi:ribose-phosphate pyrophosphokinase
MSDTMGKKAIDALLFSGTSHPRLAEEIAKGLGIGLAKAAIRRFPDGEISLQIEESVRGRDVFVVQTIALEPNDYLMELLIMVDALRRASAASITAVLPYFGYSRQDRKDKPRVPITAKLVANMLVTAGVTHVVTVDLHAGQIQGFFDVPVDNVAAKNALVNGFKERYGSDVIVVSPDVGSMGLARSYARLLNTEIAIVDKLRVSATEVETVTIIGDVKDKNVLLADDMCSTGSTLASAAKACREKGAKRIFAAVTHGVLVGNALKNIEASPIEALVISDTIPIEGRVHHNVDIHVISVAPLLAHAIRCIVRHESIESL